MNHQSDNVSVTAVGAALRLDAVSRVFRMGEVEVSALADIHMTIQPGELIVTLGPSGSGKSTFLNLVGGIDRPTTGRVWYGDDELTTMSDAELTSYRRDKVGFIFQFYNLVPTLNAYENVQVAAELVPDALEPGLALQMVDLADRAQHFPAQLSGGEQQRVAIARALAKRPQLVLADEPTGALDVAGSRKVLSVLQRLNREQNLTIILITHNPAIAAIGHRTIRLVGGRVAEIRTNEQPVEAEQVSW